MYRCVCVLKKYIAHAKVQILQSKTFEVHLNEYIQKYNTNYSYMRRMISMRVVLSQNLAIANTKLYK